MEATVKNPTPIKSKNQENANPNLAQSSPNSKHGSSPAVKSAKSHKSACKNPNPVSYISPRKKIRERKFIVAKKHAKKEDPAVVSIVTCSKCRNAKKCLCLAYENLRASQEDFFKKRDADSGDSNDSKGCEGGEVELEEEMERDLLIHDLEIGEFGGSSLKDPEFCELGQIEGLSQEGSTVKRRRDRLMEEARKSQPDVGAGKVMHLVKAFERLLTIPKKQVNEEEGDEANEDNDSSKKKPLKWALPGLPPPKASETDFSSCSFSPSELSLTAENLGLDSRASLDSSRGSISSRTSNGGQRSRRNSAESCSTFGGSRWKKKQQIRVTSLKPFKLRTEQRGRMKEEEFMKKMQELMEEEERLRIPIAQGLPWTTDEPECLIKPAVKEKTRPLDLKLHSDIRAVERSEFDQQIADKLAQIEMYKQERERLRKLAEEEEIRRLRREQVPKAQPMPYFDRPFMPKRSSKNPTIPKEPKFHIPQQKKIKCGDSLNDIGPYTYEKYQM